MEIDHEIFSSVIPQIQEGQLSVSGERMCTILVTRLEDVGVSKSYVGVITSYVDVIKGSISLKNRHFIIQERFTKLLYGINKCGIIKCGT